MKAIILAAGNGSHISPFSDTRPRPMIGIAGRTILDNSLDLLNSSGINDIFVVVGHKSEKLIDMISLIEKNLKKKAKIDFQPLQPGDVVESSANINYSFEKLGFKPIVDIEEGIPLLISWYKDFYKMNKLN